MSTRWDLACECKTKGLSPEKAFVAPFWVLSLNDGRPTSGSVAPRLRKALWGSLTLSWDDLMAVPAGPRKVRERWTIACTLGKKLRCSAVQKISRGDGIRHWWPATSYWPQMVRVFLLLFFLPAPNEFISINRQGLQHSHDFMVYMTNLCSL